MCSNLKRGTYWIFVYVFFSHGFGWIFSASPNYLILSASTGPWVIFMGPTLSVEETIFLHLFFPHPFSLSINNKIVYLPISLLRKRELEV